MNCVRCGKPTRGRIGTDCLRHVQAEMETFCRDKMNCTFTEFFDGCDEDFASDYGQTVEEYQAEHGASSDNTSYCVETLLNHGLYS